MKHRGIGNKIFDSINAALLLATGICAIIPFMYVISASLTPPEELIKHNFIIFPIKPTLMAYKYIFSTSTIPKSLMVSIFVTIVGTLISLFATALMAYPLAHTRIYGHKFFMIMITITLVFGGGMIPSYILIQKLGWLNSYKATLIPGAIGAFNLIIFKSFFQNIPAELEESAKIDGCNDLQILIKIVIPLSKPLLATFAIMFAVANWNSWFAYVLYINDPNKWPIQVVLRTIISAADASIGDSSSISNNYVPPQNIITMCVITIATVPIMIIYPFFQKYFTKGMLLGSVKG